MTAQPCPASSARMTFPAGSWAEHPPPAPAGKQVLGKLSEGIIPPQGSCPPSLHLPLQPDWGSGFTAQTEQGGWQQKTDGDRGFTGKGQFQGRSGEAEGDLQGQQQLTKQVAPRRQRSTGAGENYVLWVFIRKLVSPSSDRCDPGRGTEADGFATSLFLALEVTERGHHGSSPSQHGCKLASA